MTDYQFKYLCERLDRIEKQQEKVTFYIELFEFFLKLLGFSVAGLWFGLIARILWDVYHL